MPEYDSLLESIYPEIQGWVLKEERHTALTQSHVERMANSEYLISEKLRERAGGEFPQIDPHVAAVARSHLTNSYEPYLKVRRNTKLEYSGADTTAILMAVFLVRNCRINPKPACQHVIQFLQEKLGTPVDNPSRKVLQTVAMERVERHVLSRLTAALLMWSLKSESDADPSGEDRPEPLPPGSVVVLYRQKEKEAQRETTGEEFRNWCLERLTRLDGKAAWIVTERSELTVLRQPLWSGEEAPQHIEPVAVAVTHAGRQYFLIVGLHGRQRSLRTLPGPDKRLLGHVLYAMTEPHEELKLRNSILLAQRQNEQFPTHIRDLTLWLAMRYACLLANPQNPDKAHGVVYLPTISPETRNVQYRLYTASDWEFQHSQENLPSPIHPWQLLSGYASALRMTLGVRDTRPPHNHLVSFHDFEMAGLEEEEMPPSSICVPLPMKGGAYAPVLYLWMARVEYRQEFELRRRALQLFAPILGELIQREQDTHHTVDSAVKTVATKFLSPAELKAEMVRQLERLLKVRPSTDRRDGDRLAVVLLAPHPGNSRYRFDAVNWMTMQLSKQVPDVLMAPWLDQNPAAGHLPLPVCGHVGGRAAVAQQAVPAVMILPAWLDRYQLDRLRAAIPARLNRMGFGRTMDGDSMVRVDAWVLDFKRKTLQGDPEKAAVSMLTEIRKTGQVMHDMVTTHRYAEEGNWTLALNATRRGLDRSPQNPYLLRGAAEFSLRLGDFSAAANYAAEARSVDKASVSTFCLLGDARLGQGQLLAAMDAYRDGIKANRNHPLGYYHAGQSVLTAARLLNQWVHQAAFQVVSQGKEPFGPPEVEAALKELALRLEVVTGKEEAVAPKEHLETIRRLTRRLAGVARALLQQAWDVMDDRRGNPGEWYMVQGGAAPRGLDELACLVGIGRAARLVGGPFGSINDLHAAMQHFGQRNDLLAHELLFALMQRDPAVVFALLQDLARPAALDAVEALGRRSKPRRRFDPKP